MGYGAVDDACNIQRRNTWEVITANCKWNEFSSWRSWHSSKYCTSIIWKEGRTKFQFSCK